MKKLPLTVRIGYTTFLLIATAIAWVVITNGGASIMLIDYIAPAIILPSFLVLVWVLDITRWL